MGPEDRRADRRPGKSCRSAARYAPICRRMPSGTASTVPGTPRLLLKSTARTCAGRTSRRSRRPSRRRPPSSGRSAVIVNLCEPVGKDRREIRGVQHGRGLGEALGEIRRPRQQAGGRASRAQMLAGRAGARAGGGRRCRAPLPRHPAAPPPLPRRARARPRGRRARPAAPRPRAPGPARGPRPAAGVPARALRTVSHPFGPVAGMDEHVAPRPGLPSAREAAPWRRRRARASPRPRPSRRLRLPRVARTSPG